MTTRESFYNEYWRERIQCRRRWDPTKERRIALVLSHVGAGEKVLDYGCGVGDFTVPMLEAGADVRSVDVSERALEAARERIPVGDYKCVVPRQELPYEREEFDCIVAMEVIEHVQDTRGMFREFARVLKPGGKLLLSCPFHGFVKNLLVGVLCFEEHFAPEHAHIRFYTVASLRGILSRYGFRVDKLCHLGWFWPVYRTMYAEARKTNMNSDLGGQLARGPLKRAASCVLRSLDKRAKASSPPREPA